jgi:type IV pilus assembly protein PilN
MIRINLLPIRQIKKRQRLKTELLGFVASLIVVLVILAGLEFALGNQISTLNSQITALEQKKKSYQTILNEINKLQKDREALGKKLEVINSLQTESLLTVRILDEVASRTITNRLWLTSLQQSGARLQLQGVALDNETIAQFMRQLEASEYFRNTDLASSSQAIITGQKLTSFSLSLNVAAPKKAEAEKEQAAAPAVAAR